MGWITYLKKNQPVRGSIWARVTSLILYFNLNKLLSDKHIQNPTSVICARSKGTTSGTKNTYLCPNKWWITKIVSYHYPPLVTNFELGMVEYWMSTFNIQISTIKIISIQFPYCYPYKISIFNGLYLKNKVEFSDYFI